MHVKITWLTVFTKRRCLMTSRRRWLVDEQQCGRSWTETDHSQRPIQHWTDHRPMTEADRWRHSHQWRSGVAVATPGESKWVFVVGGVDSRLMTASEITKYTENIKWINIFNSLTKHTNIDKQTNIQRYRQTDRGTDGWTDRQTDGQTECIMQQRSYFTAADSHIRSDYSAITNVFTID